MSHETDTLTELPKHRDDGDGIDVDQELSSTDELFSMADSVNDDGTYTVSIMDWEKNQTSRSEDTVTVYFDTGFDGYHHTVYDWPKNPTEDNNFVKLLMTALGIDDPVSAISRSGSLKGPDGDEVRSPIRATRTDDGEWKLALDEQESTSSLRTVRLVKNEPVFSLFVFVVGPIVSPFVFVIIFADTLDGNMDGSDFNDLSVFYTTISMLFYGFVFSQFGMI